MNSDIVEYAINYAQSNNTDYVEARLQRNRHKIAILRNGNPEPSVDVDILGIGIRVLVNGAYSFAATNSLNKTSIKNLIDNAIKTASVQANLFPNNIKINDGKKPLNIKWNANEKEKHENFHTEFFLNHLHEINSNIENTINEVEIKNRLFYLVSSIEEKIFMNSTDQIYHSRVPRIEFHSIFGTKYGNSFDTITIPPGYAGTGKSGGVELLNDFDLVHKVPNRVKEITNSIKTTDKLEENIIDVIVGPEISGLIAHESCGHPSEADRILGREAAQAGESYLKKTNIGMKIGSEEANVTDDSTIKESMGFFDYDDEGNKSTKKELIKNGFINEFLHNSETSSLIGAKNNGSARSVQYDREPIIRMSNTFIEPGDHDFSELVSDISYGVYMKSFMEWNIDDTRMNQRYVGLESFLIENGELKHNLKNVVLELTTPKFWSSIDARSKTLEFNSATCGKGDPMQGAPVWTGGPHVRLRNIKMVSR
ncbi:MAG: TldD/PmbA family protein [Thermoproteota archaeon]